MEKESLISEMQLSFMDAPLVFDHSKDTLGDALNVEIGNDFVFTILQKIVGFVNLPDNTESLTYLKVLDMVVAESKSLEEAISFLIVVPDFWRMHKLGAKLLEDTSIPSVFQYIDHAETYPTEIKDSSSFMKLNFSLIDVNDKEYPHPSIAECFNISRKRFFEIINKLYKANNYLVDHSDEIYKSKMLEYWLAQAESYQELYFIAAYYGVVHALIFHSMQSTTLLKAPRK